MNTSLDEWINSTTIPFISFTYTFPQNYIEISTDGIKRQNNYINENKYYRFEYYLKKKYSKCDKGKYIFGIIPLVDYNEISTIVIEFILNGQKYKWVWKCDFSENNCHQYQEIEITMNNFIPFLKISKIYYKEVMVNVYHADKFITRTWVKRRKDICVSHYNKYYSTGFSDDINDINYKLVVE